MRNYDKSLVEVWEWKDRVYNDVKDLSAKEYIEKMRQDADEILKGGSVHLTTASMKKDRQNVS